MNSTMTHFNIELIEAETQQTAVIPAQRPLPATTPPQQPVIIEMPAERLSTDTLSGFLRIGREYHPLARNAFVQRVVTGYYHYERRVQLHTCAVAAAYAGAFGADSITSPQFSQSMALWRLSQRLGYDLNDVVVPSPVGRDRASVAHEMVALVDENWWTRQGVAEWLESLRL